MGRPSFEKPEFTGLTNRCTEWQAWRLISAIGAHRPAVGELDGLAPPSLSSMQAQEHP